MSWKTLSSALSGDLQVLEATAKAEQEVPFQLQVSVFACVLKFQLILEAFHGSRARNSTHSWQKSLVCV